MDKHDVYHTPSSNFTDRQVIDLRRTARQKGRPCVRENAEHLGVDPSCVEKAILGKTYKHLNEVEPPFTTKQDRALIEAEVRRLYLDENKSYKQIVKIMNIAISSVSKYCKDIVRNHKVEVSADLIEKARDLYLTPIRISEVAKEVGVKRALVEKWCRDLAPERRRRQAELRSERASQNQRRLDRKKNGAQILTDEIVVEARREARRSGVKDWKVAAAKYGVSYTTMAGAMNGTTFKHVNDQEPPIGKNELSNKRGVRRRKPKEDAVKRTRHTVPLELLDEAIALRRADPQKWTYGKVGEWLRERTGVNYRAGPTSQMLINRDPSIKTLESTGPKVYTEEEKARRAAMARERNKSLRIFMENENRREQGLAELSPEERDAFIASTTKRK